MSVDTLGRRRNRARPASTGRRVSLTSRDVAWFEKLHRHGALPSSFLSAYAGSVAENTIAKRLTLLSSEDNTLHGGRYLDRPAQQFATLDARFNQLVYDINARSRVALQASDQYRVHAPRSTRTPWKHDHFAACITASIELATLSMPERFAYIFHDEVVARMGREHFHALGVKVTPDRWGGIRYLDTGGVVLFAVEADCGTEPHSTKAMRKSTARSTMQYESWVTSGQFKRDLGTSGGIVILNVTTTKARMCNMIGTAERTLQGGKASYLLYTYVQGFSPVYKPPMPINDLFAGDLYRPGMPAFSFFR
jgi:hypothetical protein